MHEATIATDILEHIQERLKQLEGASTAVSVGIRVGEFRNVDPDSLTFAFDRLKRDYPFCQHCKLEIKLIEAVAICQQLEHTYTAKPDFLFCCPTCGSGIGQLLSGEELEIERITAEQINTRTEHNARITN